MKSSFPKRYKSILIVFHDNYIFLPRPINFVNIQFIMLKWSVGSDAGGGRSNKERQRLQLLASVARAPFCEVRRERYILNKEI